MLRNPVPPLIFMFVLIGLAGAYAFFQKSVLPRYAASRSVLAQKSEIRLGMTVQYDSGPLVREAYEMDDVDGVSSSSYRGLGRNGVAITIAERPRRTLEDGPNVAYFFGLAVQDGIWELTNRPPRGRVDPVYRVWVFQRTGEQHGSRAFSFTDPHYWATTGGHQFHLKLARDKPLPNLLQMSSDVLVEPRYEKLVGDFRAFGPDSFRTKVAAARRRLGVS